MKPSRFLYVRPQTLDGVVEQLAAFDGEAKVLAGGQSLVPLLNLRMATPEALVDINGVEELVGIDTGEHRVRIRAGTRQRVVERSGTVLHGVPLLPQALKHVAHLQIRNMGTIGGSLCHADPAAELPAVAVALGAEMSALGPKGGRTIPAADFFLESFTTALGAQEVLTEISFPLLVDARTSFVEFARRTGDFALAGVAAVISLDHSGVVADAALVACGVGPAPRRLSGAEGVLTGRPVEADTLRQVSRAAAEEISPFSDVHADESYRRKLLGALVARAIQEASE